MKKIEDAIQKHKEKIKELNKKKNDALKKDKELIGDFFISQAIIDDDLKNKIIDFISTAGNDKILDIFKIHTTKE